MIQRFVANLGMDHLSITMGKKSIKALCKAMFCILAVAFSAPLKADEKKLPFEAQALLNALGYDLGPVDGKFGEKSKNALSMHYASKENPTTPVLDKDTLNIFKSRLSWK